MRPEQAVELAKAIHINDVDKAGEPYIGHLERVASMVADFGPDYAVVAWLHDALEDHLDDMNLDYLDRVQAEWLKRITKAPSQSVDAYWAEILAAPVATAVKAADLLDNTAPSRLDRLDPATRVRLAYKYIGPVGLLARCDLPGTLRRDLKARVGELAGIIVGPPVGQERYPGDPPLA